MTIPPADEILKSISGLDAYATIKWLTSIGFTGYIGKKGYESVKSAVRTKFDEKRYAFPPDKEEANLLLQLSNDSSYKQMKLLVPHYKYIDVVRTGLLLERYHKENTSTSKEKAANINKQLSKRPNGIFLIKLAILSGQNESFGALLQYLYDLKTKENYSESQLEEKLNENLQAWDLSSKLFNNDNKIEDVIDFCKAKVNEQHREIFLIGMKHASDMIVSGLDTLNEEKYFERNNYKSFTTTLREGAQPRTTAVIRKLDVLS